MMRHIIPISGKDSCATAIVQMEIAPKRKYELFFSDVRAELPETYEWLDGVEKILNVPIKRVGKSLEQIIFNHGILPSPKMRFCTREAKIEPMEEFIGEDQATVYFGIRADEDRVGYVPLRHNVLPEYPLKKLGMNLKNVYEVLDKKGITPPTFFWKKLYDMVMEYLDRTWRRSFRITPHPHEAVRKIPRELFDRTFCWRTRSNCYFCYFQGPWEWVGLLEHHPDLFDRAETIEKTVGDDEQRTPYYWAQNRSLSYVRKNARRIFLRRALKVVKMIEELRFDKDNYDLLSVTSCGLFCGK